MCISDNDLMIMNLFLLFPLFTHHFALFFLPLSQHFFYFVSSGVNERVSEKAHYKKVPVLHTGEKITSAQLYHSVTHKTQYLSLLSITWLW